MHPWHCQRTQGTQGGVTLPSWLFIDGGRGRRSAGGGHPSACAHTVAAGPLLSPAAPSRRRCQAGAFGCWCWRWHCPALDSSTWTRPSASWPPRRSSTGEQRSPGPAACPAAPCPWENPAGKPYRHSPTGDPRAGHPSAVRGQGTNLPGDRRAGHPGLCGDREQLSRGSRGTARAAEGIPGTAARRDRVGYREAGVGLPWGKFLLSPERCPWCLLATRGRLRAPAAFPWDQRCARAGAGQGEPGVRGCDSSGERHRARTPPLPQRHCWGRDVRGRMSLR